MYVIGWPHRRHNRREWKIFRFLFLPSPIITMTYKRPINATSNFSIANKPNKQDIGCVVGAMFGEIFLQSPAFQRTCIIF